MCRRLSCSGRQERVGGGRFRAARTWATDGVVFHIGAAATDASDRIIYNPANRFLFDDRDGRGGSGETHFATLAPHLALHNVDFPVL
jgi:Ca2+-binding RTX toxin-like protein